MTKKFLVAIALMLCPWSAFSKGIHWIGEWGIGRSVSSIIPIIGNVEETTKELTLEFAEDLGDVVVTVTDASGKDEIIMNYGWGKDLLCTDSNIAGDGKPKKYYGLHDNFWITFRFYE